jgi:hypothetical protein
MIEMAPIETGRHTDISLHCTMQKRLWAPQIFSLGVHA